LSGIKEEKHRDTESTRKPFWKPLKLCCTDFEGMVFMGVRKDLTTKDTKDSKENHKGKIKNTLALFLCVLRVLCGSILYQSLNVVPSRV
jgi:hypothetical protein